MVYVQLSVSSVNQSYLTRYFLMLYIILVYFNTDACMYNLACQASTNIFLNDLNEQLVRLANT
jgi:hypothetical protein